MTDLNYCYGCGVALQTTDENAPGYVAPQVIGRSSILCQRCHTLKHHCPQTSIHAFHNEYASVISSMKQNSLVIVMLDAFHLRTTLLKSLFDAIKSYPVIVLINKMDVYPSSVSVTKIVTYVQTILAKWKINVIDIVPMSVKNGQDPYRIFQTILDQRAGRNIYIMGAANVGKSSFINAILRQFSNDSTHQISTSPYPGTTLTFIEIPLDEDSFLYDTPGVIPDGSYTGVIECKLFKYLLPKKTIKPLNYAFNRGQSLHIGGLARVDILEGNHRFVGYFHPEIKFHRSPLSEVDGKFDHLAKQQLIFPVTEMFHPLHKASSHHYQVVIDGKMDVLLVGLGWFTIVGHGPAEFTIKTPALVTIELRPALI